MKYTKDEEARAERSSVKMWPGITAGIIIGLIAFVLSFDALRLVFVACGINPYLSWGGPVCVDGTIRHAGPGHPVRTAGIGSRTG